MDMGNQLAAIGIVIHMIKKYINLFFARSATESRYGVLRDPLHDCNPLDHALMTSLCQITIETLKTYYLMYKS